MDDTLHDAFLDPSTRFDAAQQFLNVLLTEDYSPEQSTTLMGEVATMPIFQSILLSLLLDTDNTLFSIVLRCFLAVLPYAPSTITPKVPLIMVVLGRAACWQDRPFSNDPDKQGVTRTPEPNARLNWAKAMLSPETNLPIPLQPSNITRLLFVATYSAWPSNVLAFVRDPVAYIIGKGTEPIYGIPWEEVWSPGLLASRSGPLLRNFHLHPWLVYFTSTTELADEKRWDRIDPPEFITRSHMLAHSELMAGQRFDLLEGEPEVPPAINESVATEVEQLQRDVRLLRLEAKFADRVRKQYLYHIGRLHKHTLRFNTDESEIHSFVSRLKDQNKTIDTLTAELAQQRADATQAQNKHVKWQEQLREKLATYREERKTWQNDAARLRGELGEVKTAFEKQKEDLAGVKNERFKLENQLAEVGPKVRHIEDYEARMRQLVESQKLWDNDLRRLKEAEDREENWRARCYKLETLLRACEREKEEQSQHIMELQRGLVQQEASPTPARKLATAPGMDFYIAIAENAKKRVELLEKENLELQVETGRAQQLRSSGKNNHLL